MVHNSTASDTGDARPNARPKKGLAELVRDLANESALLAYSSAGHTGEEIYESRRHAIRAGILHRAADALSDGALGRQDDAPEPNGMNNKPSVDRP